MRTCLAALVAVSLTSACSQTPEKTIEERAVDEAVRNYMTVQVADIERMTKLGCPGKPGCNDTRIAIDLCVRAGIVAAASVQAGDTENYNKWRETEREDCARAGIPK